MQGDPSIGTDLRKRTDRKRGAGNDAQRDGEEAKARPRQPAEVAAEVLDDKDLLGKEPRCTRRLGSLLSSTFQKSTPTSVGRAWSRSSSASGEMYGPGSQ
jgi:hypothetical protein